MLTREKVVELRNTQRRLATLASVRRRRWRLMASKYAHAVEMAADDSLAHRADAAANAYGLAIDQFKIDDPVGYSLLLAEFAAFVEKYPHSLKDIRMTGTLAIYLLAG